MAHLARRPPTSDWGLVLAAAPANSSTEVVFQLPRVQPAVLSMAPTRSSVPRPYVLEKQNYRRWTLAWGQMDGMQLCNRAAQSIAFGCGNIRPRQHHRLE